MTPLPGLGTQVTSHKSHKKTLCRAGLQRHPSKGQFQVPSQVLHDHLGYEVNIPHNLLRVSSIDMYNNDVGKGVVYAYEAYEAK